jgi:SecY
LPATSTGVLRRAAITAAVVALVVLAQGVAPPFVDGEALRSLIPDTTLAGRAQVSVLGLGMGPFLSMFMFVELVALVLPRLRPLRLGSDRDRRPLTRAAWALGVVLAAVWGLAWADFLAILHGTHGESLVEEGLGPILGVAATLALGAVALGCAAVVVSRHGLGNGFAVLLALTGIESGIDLVRAMLRTPRAYWTDASLVVLLAVAVVLPIVLANRRPAPAGGPRVPVPTCGLVVLVAPAVIVGFAARVVEWFPREPPLPDWLWPGESYTYARIALTAALSLVLARAFCGRAAVVAAYRRAARGPPADPADAAVGRALTRSHARSVALALGLAVLPLAAARVGVPTPIWVETIFGLAMAIAVALDLRDEARWRARRVPWALAHPSQRVYAVEPALDALRTAGIDAVARTARFRALFHFFAPFAPIEIFVPEDRVGEAAGICARVVAG